MTSRRYAFWERAPDKAGTLWPITRHRKIKAILIDRGVLCIGKRGNDHKRVSNFLGVRQTAWGDRTMIIAVI